MLQHPPLAFVRGDTVTIDGVLFQGDGSPYDLSVASIEWTLVTLDGATVLATATIDDAVQIVDAPGGGITITIPASLSATFLVGHHRDQLRVTRDGQKDTLWTGSIHVRPSFFSP